MAGFCSGSRTFGWLYFVTLYSALGCVETEPSSDAQVGEEVQGESSSTHSSNTTFTSDTQSSHTNSGASSNPSSGTTNTSSSASTTTTATTSTATVTDAETTVTASTSASSDNSGDHSTSPSGTDDVDSSTVDPTSSDGPDGGESSGNNDASVPVCPAEPALTGGQQYCSNVKNNVGNGYGYELWAEGNGTGCMTVFGQGAAFKANWTDVEDFLARVGLDFDETRTHQQIGTIVADFAETQAGSEEGLTYVGIYGWTVDPLREFYILDDWGTTKPAGVASDGSPRDEVGTMEIDGETYDVWKKTRENKPSIKGDATFDQYFSIRRTRRQCGRISVSEHFSGWEDLGLPLGKLYEVKILVESQFNSGSVEFSSASVVAD